MQNLAIQNLDTVYNLTMFEALSPYVLSGSFGLGFPRATNVSVDMSLDIVSPDRFVDDDMTLSLSLSNLTSNFMFLAQVNNYRFESLKLKDLSNYSCWAGMLEDVGFISLNSGFADFDMGLGCHDCTSPMLPELSERMATNESKAELTTSVNLGLATLDGHIVDLHKKLQKGVAVQRSICDNIHVDPNDLPNSKNGTQPDHGVHLDRTLFIALGVVLGSALFGYVVVTCYNAYWKETSIAAGQLRRSRGVSAYHEPEMMLKNVSLFSHEAVPWYAQWGVPIFLLTNCIFFVTGHATQGASVDVLLHVAGESITIRSFFTFSLGSSLKDMWTAGAYPLAVLIGTFSGAWPYLKLILLAFCWFGEFFGLPWSAMEFVDLILDSHISLSPSLHLHPSAPANSHAKGPRTDPTDSRHARQVVPDRPLRSRHVHECV